MRGWIALLGAAALALAGACDAGETAAEADATGDAASDVPAMVDVPEAPPRPQHSVFLVSEMAFTLEDSGVAPGYDLDGLVSTGNETTGCAIEDFTSPEGVEGIDNQLALLMPFVEAAGINQLPEYLQGAILEGGIMVVGVVEGIDDPLNDDQVTLTLLRGTGRPLVDLENRIEAWQTVGIAEELPVLAVSTTARIEDGIVRGAFDRLFLPVQVFDVTADLDLSYGRFSFPVTPGDERAGYGAGGLDVDQLVEIIEKTPSGNLGEVIQNLGDTFTDLDGDGDGECDAISSVLEVHVVPAYVPEDDLERTIGAP